MEVVYNTLGAAKISRIDTARRYPKSSPGSSEQLLGSTGAVERGFVIDTKINVTSIAQSGGSLSQNKIKESIAASLTALRDHQDLTGTRYAQGNPMGASYRPMYDKQAMHAAVKELYSGLQPHRIQLAEASLRWAYYHSALQEGDGIILGASDIVQFEENIRWIARGRLEKNIVKMFEEIWEKIKDVAP
ncbi:MAG: hypothetical protein Q9167_005510 [Letrouitia subvulpina]